MVTNRSRHRISSERFDKYKFNPDNYGESASSNECLSFLLYHYITRFTKNKMMFRKKYTSEEIIAGLLAHDIKIYRYIDVEYRPKVIKHVGHNSGSREDGEDLYQDTLYRVYVNAEEGKYDSKRSKFGTYFMMIAIHRWIDVLRRNRGSLYTTSMDNSHEELTDFDAVAQAEQDLYYQRVQAMRACIAQLTKEEQEMIELFYYAKKSLDTIAHEMGISYKYTKQKMYRIRKKLRDMLGNDPDFDLQFV